MKIICLSSMFLLISSICLAGGMSDWEVYKQTGDKSPKWDSYIEQGFSSFDSGNLGAGELFLQRAIARGCNDGLVYIKIGLYNEAQKNYKKAIEYIKKASKKLHEQYKNHMLTKSLNEIYGRVLYLDGETDTAAVYLEKAVSESENFTSLYFLGQIKRDRNDFESAVKYFERAFKAKPPPGVSLNIGVLIMIEIGKSYYELKNFDASLSWWNKILNIDPNNQTALSYKTSIEQQKFKEKEKKMIEEIVK